MAKGLCIMLPLETNVVIKIDVNYILIFAHYKTSGSKTFSTVFSFFAGNTNGYNHGSLLSLPAEYLRSHIVLTSDVGCGCWRDHGNFLHCHLVLLLCK